VGCAASIAVVSEEDATEEGVDVVPDRKATMITTMTKAITIIKRATMNRMMMAAEDVADAEVVAVVVVVASVDAEAFVMEAAQATGDVAAADIVVQPHITMVRAVKGMRMASTRVNEAVAVVEDPEDVDPAAEDVVDVAHHEEEDAVAADQDPMKTAKFNSNSTNYYIYTTFRSLYHHFYIVPSYWNNFTPFKF